VIFLGATDCSSDDEIADGLFFGFVSDDLDRLSDDALSSYLTGAAAESKMRVVIEERNGEWFAESRAPSGLGGEMVVLGANGPDRRTAMLRLARLFADGR
jgi:hypothetical protein